MTNLHELFEDATTTAPPSRLSVEDVFTATRAHRRRRRLKNALVALTTMAIAVSAGLLVRSNFALPPSTGAAPPKAITWAARGDARHLYLIKNLCANPFMTSSPEIPDSSTAPEQVERPPAPEGGCEELLASADGGASWVSRGTRILYAAKILGPRTLMRYGGEVGTPAPVVKDPMLLWEVSLDAGATWNKLRPMGAPIGAAPAGSFVIDFQGRLVVFDHAQGRLRPLASQPPLRATFGTLYHVEPSHIWFSGLTQVTHQPAIVVSHDGGATWTARELPGAPAQPQPTEITGEIETHLFIGDLTRLITGDAMTAYATMRVEPAQPTSVPPTPRADEAGQMRTWRTTDGGSTWQAIAETSSAPSLSVAWITADGRIVTWLGPYDGASSGRYAMSVDGITYELVTPPGLPQTVYSIDGSVAFNDFAFYVSDDGWSWREAWRYQ